MTTTADFIKSLMPPDGGKTKTTISADCIPAKADPHHKWQVAAHCAIYAKTGDSRRALVMMQVRFDGYLGFPGGLVDPEDPSVVDGLNRELSEEINLSPDHKMTQEQFVACTYEETSEGKADNLRYLYAKQVTEDQFKQIEVEGLAAKDYGTEVMGLFRVPIVNPYPTDGDSLNAIKHFLGHKLLNREHLMLFLLHAEILTRDELTSICS